MASVVRDKMMYVAFGRRFNPSALRAAREAAGFTQEGLSELLGRNRKNLTLVCLYENGHMKPSLPMLRRIVQLLKCSADELAPRVS